MILISIPSAVIADYFKVPLAWMIGPMIAVSIAALNGLKIYMPKLALSIILIILITTVFNACVIETSQISDNDIDATVEARVEK